MPEPPESRSCVHCCVASFLGRDFPWSGHSLAGCAEGVCCLLLQILGRTQGTSFPVVDLHWLVLGNRCFFSCLSLWEEPELMCGKWGSWGGGKADGRDVGSGRRHLCCCLCLPLSFPPGLWALMLGLFFCFSGYFRNHKILSDLLEFSVIVYILRRLEAMSIDSRCSPSHCSVCRLFKCISIFKHFFPIVTFVEKFF